jgi:hypothetical protein
MPKLREAQLKVLHTGRLQRYKVKKALAYSSGASATKKKSFVI